MMPFLSTDLYDLMKCLMNIVIKFDIMLTVTNAIKLCEVNVTDTNNHQHYKEVDVGFSVDKLL